ncbi:MAG: GTP-binding protein, partial [Candidatus Heimdallarchaeota archaeon]
SNSKFLDDNTSVAELIVNQIEFSNIVLINKIDLVDSDEIEKSKNIIFGLNSDIEIIPTKFTDVPLDKILNTNLFHVQENEPRWRKLLSGNHDNLMQKDKDSRDHEDKVKSFVYKRNKPFEKKKFEKFVSSEQKGVIRSKGFIWLIDDMNRAYNYSQAGKIKEITLGEMFWWVALDQDLWPASDQFYSFLKNIWNERWGDRRQELVFIGIDMDEKEIVKNLDSCLMNDNDLDEFSEKIERIYYQFPD